VVVKVLKEKKHHQGTIKVLSAQTQMRLQEFLAMDTSGRLLFFLLCHHEDSGK
jgi:hypothetical protein